MFHLSFSCTEKAYQRWTVKTANGAVKLYKTILNYPRNAILQSIGFALKTARHLKTMTILPFWLWRSSIRHSLDSFLAQPVLSQTHWILLYTLAYVSPVSHAPLQLSVQTTRQRFLFGKTQINRFTTHRVCKAIHTNEGRSLIQVNQPNTGCTTSSYSSLHLFFVFIILCEEFMLSRQRCDSCWCFCLSLRMRHFNTNTRAKC